MTRPSGQRGMAARARHYKKIKDITEEEALENYKEKQRRLTEKLGWNDDWHKKKVKKRHGSRVKHTGHGRG